MQSDEYKTWFTRADDYLKWTKDNLKDGNYPLVCFLSQQAIEIAFKGFIYFKDKVPPKTHDLVKVLDDAKNLGLEIGEELSENLDTISDYYFESRYPDVEDRSLDNKQIAEEALESAIKIVKKVKSSLPSA